MEQKKIEPIRDARKLGKAKMLILGIQHMFAMFGATILVPILVSGYFQAACGEELTRGLSVSVTLFCAGFGTLIFHLCTKFKVPAFLGSSFAFLGGFYTVANLDSGMYAGMSANDKAAYACGGIFVAGMLYFVLALIIKLVGVNRVMKFLPPVVTGPIIICIGLSLAGSAITNASTNWLLAFVSLAVIIIFNIWGKGLFKIIPILMGVVISYVFALIFIGIAVLVIATSMSRMVEKQRTQIGTMNALGMKRSKILFHYISFSLIASGLGAAAGMFLGVFLGAPYMLDLFGAYYIVPGRKSEFNMIYLVILLAIIVICAFAAYVSCRKLLKIKPAEALRPAAPRAGKKCLAERLPFWGKLSFSAQYNLRDISRGKMRAFMSIAGTAFGMLLMVYGAGCNGLLAEMEAIVFDKTTPAQYQIKLDEDADADEVKKLASSLDGELIMTSALEVSAVKNATSGEKQKGVLTVTEGKKLYNILNLDNEVTDVEPGTVALSRKFADELNLKVGDTVYWHLYTRNEWHEAKIGVIYRSSETQGMTMLYDDYKNTHETYQPTMLMSDKTRDNLKSDACVTSVNTKDQMREAYENSMEVVNMLVYIMMIFSATCVVVVLYNSGSLSFNERVKELATLKVLGFQSGAIRKMMSQQNVWFSVIGIILGAPFGRASFNMMMNSNGENFDYNLSIRPIAYLEAGIFVLVVSVLVSFMFSKRIKKLDMVEVLKGVE